MDARIDTNELVSNITTLLLHKFAPQRSVLSKHKEEEEMLELAVQSGMEVVVLTTHSDCAAEKAAASAEKRKQFPSLVQAVDEREMRTRELLRAPLIASRIAEGKLAVKQINIDTLTEQILPR